MDRHLVGLDGTWHEIDAWPDPADTTNSSIQIGSKRKPGRCSFQTLPDTKRATHCVDNYVGGAELISQSGGLQARDCTTQCPFVHCRAHFTATRSFQVRAHLTLYFNVPARHSLLQCPHTAAILSFHVLSGHLRVLYSMVPMTSNFRPNECQ